METNSDGKPHAAYLSHVANNTHTQTFSSSPHTLALHVIVFNLMGVYRAFKAAHYLRLHHKVTPKHHTTHCQNADATVQACTTVNTTMLHT